MCELLLQYLQQMLESKSINCNLFMKEQCSQPTQEKKAKAKRRKGHLTLRVWTWINISLFHGNVKLVESMKGTWSEAQYYVHMDKLFDIFLRPVLALSVAGARAWGASWNTGTRAPSVISSGCTGLSADTASKGAPCRVWLGVQTDSFQDAQLKMPNLSHQHASKSYQATHIDSGSLGLLD